jgi:dihydrofolate reductase
MPIISIIAAFDLQWIIGNKGKLPWEKPIPADWDNLYKVTKGKKMIMGRKSFEDENRVWSEAGNFVVSSQSNIKLDPGFELVANLKEALLQIKTYEEVFVIGGQKLFEEVLPYTKNLHITLVKSNFEGDRFFPKFDKKDYNIISERKIEPSLASPYPIEISHLESKNPREYFL